MFKIENEHNNFALFHDIQSQISSSSIYAEYMGDTIRSWDPCLTLNQQSDASVDESMLIGKQYLKNIQENHRLALIIEAGFQKLFNNIDMLMSAQNAISDILKF